MFAHMAVLKFCNDRPNFQTIKAYIIKDWNLDGGFEVSLMHPIRVVFLFDDKKELVLALTRSYRSFLGINFKIFQWRPGLSTKVDLRFIPVWVEIPFLKYEFFTPAFLKAIGYEIGLYLAMDVASYKRSYTKKARICMEMDMDEPLSEKIYLEYKNLTSIAVGSP